jgi:hypothetical protein
MVKFVVMMILSLVITQILHLLFSEETAGLKKREEKVFKVILNQGVIGCISQEKFDNVQNLYNQNNQKEIKKILNNKDCFIFSEGEEFTGLDNYCNEDSKLTDSFIFGSKKFMLTKIILPCFAFKND